MPYNHKNGSTSNTPTPRQKELLMAMTRFIEKMERFPSYSDMAKALGCNKHTIRELIAPLERKGLIARIPGVAHSLKPANLRLVVSTKAVRAA